MSDSIVPESQAASDVCSTNDPPGGPLADAAVATASAPDSQKAKEEVALARKRADEALNRDRAVQQEMQSMMAQSNAALKEAKDTRDLLVALQQREHEATAVAPRSEKEALKARIEALSTELLLLKKKAATTAASSSRQRTAPNPSAPAGNRRLATSAAKSLLKTYVPTAPVAVVGSVASGLALDASDVDLVACLAGVRSAATFPCLLGDEPLGDPLLVLLLCGDHLPSVRVRKQSKKARRTGRPRMRNKGDVDAALESTLEEHGFEAPRWARGSPLLRMVHRATGVAVDVWMDEAASDVAECEAKRRVDATRAAVLAPGGALLAGLHCLLRRAVGRELRELEGYAGGGGAGGGGGLGSYVTLLLVRRFLQRERVATVQPPPTQEALLVLLLTSLAATGGEDECTIEKLEDLLPGAPPLKVYPGKGTRMLRALCSTVLARLHAGASLEPLLHSHETEGWAVRAALVSDVLAAAQAGAQDKTAKPSKRARGSWARGRGDHGREGHGREGGVKSRLGYAGHAPKGL